MKEGTTEGRAAAGLLGRVKNRLTATRKEWTDDRRSKAPDFRIFSFFRLREPTLSLIMKGLLDPNGTHGQGRLFLEEFLRTVQDRAKVRVPIFLYIKEKDPKLCPEFRLKDGRGKLDLYLEFPGPYAIGVEIKPYGAPEQKDQLERYRQGLKEIAKEHFFLLYLPDNDAKPSSIDPGVVAELERKGQYAKSRFGDFVKSWIRPCMSGLPERVKYFLEEFMSYADEPSEGTFLTSKEARNLVIEESIADKESLGAALAIHHSYHSLLGRCYSGFMEALYQRLKRQRPIGWDVKSYVCCMNGEQWSDVPPEPKLSTEAMPENEWLLVSLEKRYPWTVPPLPNGRFIICFEVGRDEQGKYTSTLGLRRPGDYAGNKKDPHRTSELLNKERELLLRTRLTEVCTEANIGVREGDSEPTDWNWHWNLDDPSADERVEAMWIPPGKDENQYLLKVSEMLQLLAAAVDELDGS
jgi:hypothetical protein